MAVTAILEDAKLDTSATALKRNGRTSSTLGAGFNCFCTMVGTGILQLAYGVAETGWIGVGIYVVMCLMSAYTSIILIRCIDLIKEIRARDRKASEEEEVLEISTYGDIGEAAFGSAGKWIVNVQLNLVLVSVAAIFNLLAGLNLSNIAPLSWDWLTPELSTVLCSLIMWLHVFLKTMAEVSAISGLNAFFTTILPWVIFVETLRHPPAEPPRTTLVVTDVMKLGAGFASFCFASCVHVVLPSVHRSMVKPQEFDTMIKWTFAALFVVTLPMVVAGYAVYGDAVQSPVYSTPALASSPWVTAMIALATLHLILAYALLLNPCETAVESYLDVDRRRMSLLWRMALRSIFVAFTCGVSVFFGTSFAPLVELVAAVAVSTTVFAFPCTFYIRLSKMAGKPLSLPELSFNLLMIVMCMVGSLFGMIGAVQDMLKSW